MADGTVKQRNMLTGTEVWTVPGRGNRPLSVPTKDPKPITSSGDHCAFCEKRYLETPPEKARLVRQGDGWKILRNVKADQLFATTAEFRRIPNLFEIMSANYWAANYNAHPSSAQHQLMAEYLVTGYDHIMQIMRTKLAASGLSETEIAGLAEDELLSGALGFFYGGHDVIVARRHFIEGATTDDQLASSGTLSPQEHDAYMRMTVDALENLYEINQHVKYVAAFQNWLKPAGASFDHLHKQLVAIDEVPIQISTEIDKLRRDEKIYDDILQVAASRDLVLAQNEHAVAVADFGHRFPTVAVWALGAAKAPWEAPLSVRRSVSDILHAMHAATGAEVPCNEEWYHRPRNSPAPVRWRILLKWRISTLAGFEGGTRIYLNTIDPWGVRDRMIPRLQKLREDGKIANMRIGSECKVDPHLLQG